MSSPFDFHGQVVLVTGGAKGLGRGIAKAFVDAGAVVVACGRNEPPALALGVSFLRCDVRDSEAVAQMIDAIMSEHGRLDVVINNAGGAPHALVADSSPRFQQSVINLNLVAPLLVAMRANAIMQTQDGGGVIINVSSVSAHRPAPGAAAYAAAKAGLESLTVSLAAEWAPKVRVNCVVAGLIRTEQSHLHYGDEEGIAAVGKVVPIGRMADPADLASVFLFLASPHAAYMTGSNVPVHGGGELPAFLALSTADHAKPSGPKK